MTRDQRLDVDFEDVYQGRSLVPGAEVPIDVAPWDIAGPQPEVVALAESGAFRGAVLDAGCGLGENAIYLASRGLRVTGADGAETALRKARERAARAGVEVEFTQVDVTTFDGVEQRFDTVLDSALYHCLGDEQRLTYAGALWRVTAPGATLHLLCFADVGNEGFRLPLSVTQDDLRDHLGGWWEIREIEPADYTMSMTQDAVERMGVENLRRTGVTHAPEHLRTDDRGRIVGRMWRLRADRAPTPAH
ncbi:class I SAM-dependent methyltransferase [Actinophytocola oryzae]|uniref:Methyltransferase family protein n=1 Tax=Actinophytocola oryzae TaxID=502181 RepID=A0A4R7W5P1_9PSEU|nr:class I SAM-dependent methyltransferase [Actinophytocola oryzae]TDV57575.1 methyltransferase family protein [Actinophytocola oryzae]